LKLKDKAFRWNSLVALTGCLTANTFCSPVFMLLNIPFISSVFTLKTREPKGASDSYYTIMDSDSEEKAELVINLIEFYIKE